MSIGKVRKNTLLSFCMYLRPIKSVFVQRVRALHFINRMREDKELLIVAEKPCENVHLICEIISMETDWVVMQW